MKKAKETKVESGRGQKIDKVRSLDFVLGAMGRHWRTWRGDGGMMRLFWKDHVTSVQRVDYRGSTRQSRSQEGCRYTNLGHGPRRI